MKQIATFRTIPPPLKLARHTPAHVPIGESLRGKAQTLLVASHIDADLLSCEHVNELLTGPSTITARPASTAERKPGETHSTQSAFSSLA
jgi:hypothetical protein